MTVTETEAPPLTEKDGMVLRRMMREGAQTVDEFVSARGWYVNTWAPVFTGLRQRGLLARTGERRRTTHGALAHVITITDFGLDALRAVQ